MQALQLVSHCCPLLSIFDLPNNVLLGGTRQSLVLFHAHCVVKCKNWRDNEHNVHGLQCKIGNWADCPFLESHYREEKRKRTVSCLTVWCRVPSTRQKQLIYRTSLVHFFLIVQCTKQFWKKTFRYFSAFVHSHLLHPMSLYVATYCGCRFGQASCFHRVYPPPPC